MAKIMTGVEAAQFVNDHEWKFAKTMPHIPHWYIVQAQVHDDERFKAFAMKIFHDGKLMTWGRWSRRYLDIGEFRYWSMDPTPEETDLINREMIEGSKARSIA